MKNKYQEALDRLRVDCNGRYDENGNSIPALSQKDGNDSLDTLQELIDNYHKITVLMRSVLIVSGRPVKDTSKQHCYEVLEQIQKITKSNWTFTDECKLEGVRNDK